MKKKAIVNARIIDPKNNIDQLGGILINELGQIEKSGPEITKENVGDIQIFNCLLYTSPSPRDLSTSRMPSSA